MSGMQSCQIVWRSACVGSDTSKVATGRRVESVCSVATLASTGPPNASRISSSNTFQFDASTISSRCAKSGTRSKRQHSRTTFRSCRDNARSSRSRRRQSTMRTPTQTALATLVSSVRRPDPSVPLATTSARVESALIIATETCRCGASVAMAANAARSGSSRSSPSTRSTTRSLARIGRRVCDTRGSQSTSTKPSLARSSTSCADGAAPTTSNVCRRDATENAVASMPLLARARSASS